MIRPIAFANAIAVMTAGLALFLMALRLLVPQFFVFFFTPSFSGRMLPHSSHPTWRSRTRAPTVLDYNAIGVRNVSREA